MDISQAVNHFARVLSSSGVSSSRLDAEILISHVTGLSRLELITKSSNPLHDNHYATLENLISRRQQFEPIAYIIGEKEFYGRSFKVRSGVLIPRPDTETIIETVKCKFPDALSKINILELGVGSGAIINTLLCEYKNAQGIGIDLHDIPIQVSRENSIILGTKTRLKLKQGSWFSPICNDFTRFDLIVSNPPYIESSEIEQLMPDVKIHEPLSALDGGEDGLDDYRLIISQACDKLAKNGWIVFEVGHTQAPAVVEMFDEQKWQNIQIIQDLANVQRVVCAQRV